MLRPLVAAADFLDPRREVILSPKKETGSYGIRCVEDLVNGTVRSQALVAIVREGGGLQREGGGLGGSIAVVVELAAQPFLFTERENLCEFLGLRAICEAVEQPNGALIRPDDWSRADLEADLRRLAFLARVVLRNDAELVPARREGRARAGEERLGRCRRAV